MKRSFMRPRILCFVKICVLALLFATLGWWLARGRGGRFTNEKNPTDVIYSKPEGDTFIIGEAEAIEDLTKYGESAYRVKVFNSNNRTLEGRIIYIKLLTINVSNDLWTPYKIKIAPPPFRGVFILEKTNGELYVSKWIIPEGAFAWPPDRGLLNYIKDSAIR